MKWICEVWREVQIGIERGWGLGERMVPDAAGTRRAKLSSHMLHHLVRDVLWPAQKGQQEEIGMSGAAAVAGGEEGGLGVRACGAVRGAASWTGQQMVGNARLVDRPDDIICARGHKEGSLEPAETGGAVGTLAAVAGKQALFRHWRHFIVQLRRVWGGKSGA